MDYKDKLWNINTSCEKNNVYKIIPILPDTTYLTLDLAYLSFVDVQFMSLF